LGPSSDTSKSAGSDEAFVNISDLDLKLDGIDLEMEDSWILPTLDEVDLNFGIPGDRRAGLGGMDMGNGGMGAGSMNLGVLQLDDVDMVVLGEGDDEPWREIDWDKELSELNNSNVEAFTGAIAVT